METVVPALKLLIFNSMMRPNYHLKLNQNTYPLIAYSAPAHPVVFNNYCISINDQISIFNMVKGKLPKLPKRWTRAHALWSAVGSAAAGTRAIRVPILNANFVFLKQNCHVMTVRIHDRILTVQEHRVSGTLHFATCPRDIICRGVSPSITQKESL